MNILNLANCITIGRIILMYVLVWMIYSHDVALRIAAFFMAIVIIILDALDGYVARKRNETSQFGGVLDITGDRIVENVFWIVFADLDIIPMWIPIFMMSRGFITDAMRSQALTKGKTAFGENTMMVTHLGKFLVSGRFMRAFYGVIKGITFPYLIFLTIFTEKVLHNADLGQLAWLTPHAALTGTALSIFTAVVSLVRGLPVLIEGRHLFTNNS
ncbi:CDP-alcohol phosphatidyltransferase family protein [bacterium]|nr:CDP-alcohol phosphatidyltransferase family protein [bacterium]